MVMRFSVDAHAIGQHLTGNETYIRNLLNCFAKLDRQADFVTYLSRETAFENVPERFFKRRVAVNSLRRPWLNPPWKFCQASPKLRHPQYTRPPSARVPLCCR